MLVTHPDLGLARPLPPPALSGEFEVHLTVEPGAVDALAEWAAANGLTYTHILLARGAAVSQPMLNLRASGTLDEVAAAAARTARRLTDAGFAVLRTKVEAAPWADGVPATDGEAAQHGPGRYFEHHVKLLLVPGEDTTRLAALAVRHGAHLSRNARRVRADGLREQFVTQRCRLVGLATAGRRLAALLGELAVDGREVVSVEREFVAVDSAEALDSGWITRTQCTEDRSAGGQAAGRRLAPRRVEGAAR
ncbi:hypothetical protein AB0C76_19780 [Kitasatospora sp. NPDC048722]|uniref:hypothetical protein n=1 Tax=Kitasatospora sp. NPDC048722 TaxID=3155639 RepID=UPI0033DB319B